MVFLHHDIKKFYSLRYFYMKTASKRFNIYRVSQMVYMCSEYRNMYPGIYFVRL